MDQNLYFPFSYCRNCFVWVFFCLWFFFFFVVLNKTPSSDLCTELWGWFPWGLSVFDGDTETLSPGARGQWSGDSSLNTSTFAQLVLVKTWNSVSNESQWFLSFVSRNNSWRQKWKKFPCLFSLHGEFYTKSIDAEMIYKKIHLITSTCFGLSKGR